MKKILCIAMVLMMAIGLIIPAFGSAESVTGRSSMYVYCANGKRLNVRVAPAVNATLLFRLENGEKVSILEDSGNGWARVSNNGRAGYVKTEYLRAQMPAAAGKQNSTFKSFSAKVYSTNGKKVNMRVKANVKADRIAQLENYTAIQVVGEAGDWYKIQWANATGYMMKKYVRS